MNNHRIITRTRWDGSRMITQRFRVQRKRMVPVPPPERARMTATELLVALFACVLWFFACLLMTLEVIR